MNWREIRSPKLATRENPKLETHNPKLKTVHRPFLAKESHCPTRVTGRLKWNRQGLWIADLRTPPGQECSNGSMLFVAVVL
jgi:hypothetical protein